MADQEQKTETAEEKPSEEQTPAPTTESSEETKAAAPESQPPPETAAPPAAVPVASEKVEPVSETGQETIAAPPAGRDGFSHTFVFTKIIFSWQSLVKSTKILKKKLIIILKWFLL